MRPVLSSTGGDTNKGHKITNKTLALDLEQS